MSKRALAVFVFTLFAAAILSFAEIRGQSSEVGNDSRLAWNDFGFRGGASKGSSA